MYRVDKFMLDETDLVTICKDLPTVIEYRIEFQKNLNILCPRNLKEIALPFLPGIVIILTLWSMHLFLISYMVHVMFLYRHLII